MVDGCAVAFSDLPRASAETFIAFIQGMEGDPDWDTFLYGHASGRDIMGTRDDARQYRECLQDLTSAVRAARIAGLPDNSEDMVAAVRAARNAGLPDNSEDMVAAVRAALVPRYGTRGNFANGLAANIRGVIRWWSR